MYRLTNFQNFEIPSGCSNGYLPFQELRGGAMVLEEALDWLCLHLPAASLPKQFQGISQVASASGKASIVARASHSPAAGNR